MRWFRFTSIRVSLTDSQVSDTWAVWLTDSLTDFYPLDSLTDNMWGTKPPWWTIGSAPLRLRCCQTRGQTKWPSEQPMNCLCFAILNANTTRKSLPITRKIIIAKILYHQYNSKIPPYNSKIPPYNPENPTLYSGMHTEHKAPLITFSFPPALTDIDRQWQQTHDFGQRMLKTTCKWIVEDYVRSWMSLTLKMILEVPPRSPCWNQR